MRTFVNHNQGSPRVRVHGQGCGKTAAAASTPRSAPAPPRPRPWAPAREARVLPLPPRPSGPSPGTVGAGATSSPLHGSLLFPGLQELFQEVTTRFVSSPASCPCPASRSHQAGAGVVGAAFTCVRAHRQTPCIHTHSRSQSLSTPQHTHTLTHSLTYARLLRHPPGAHSRGWDGPELQRLGARGGKTQQAMHPHPSTLPQLPPPPRASLRKPPTPPHPFLP